MSSAMSSASRAAITRAQQDFAAFADEVTHEDGFAWSHDFGDRVLASVRAAISGALLDTGDVTSVLEALWPVIRSVAKSAKLNEWSKRGLLAALVSTVRDVTLEVAHSELEMAYDHDYEGDEDTDLSGENTPPERHSGRILGMLAVFLPPRYFARLSILLPSLAAYDGLSVVRGAMDFMNWKRCAGLLATRSTWENNAHDNVVALLNSTTVNGADVSHLPDFLHRAAGVAPRADGRDSVHHAVLAFVNRFAETTKASGADETWCARLRAHVVALFLRQELVETVVDGHPALVQWLLSSLLPQKDDNFLSFELPLAFSHSAMHCKLFGGRTFHADLHETMEVVAALAMRSPKLVAAVVARGAPRAEPASIHDIFESLLFRFATRA